MTASSNGRLATTSKGRSATTVRADDRAMKLMAFADGELEGAELAEVERWLEEDAEAVLFANDLAELGDLLQEGHKPPPKFDIADAVMAQIAPAEAEPAKKSNVVPLKRPVAAPSQKSTVGWIVAGLALAASVFFVTRAKQNDEAPIARTTSPLVQPAPAASAGSVDVENPGSSVSVIYVPDDQTPNVTTTIWVDDNGGK